MANFIEAEFPVIDAPPVLMYSSVDESLYLGVSGVGGNWIQLGAGSQGVTGLQTALSVGYCLFDAPTSVTTLTSALGWAVPLQANNWQLSNVTAGVDTSGTTNSTTINVRRRRSGADATMLSTLCAVKSGNYYDSTTAVVLYGNRLIQTGDRVYTDVAAVSTTPPKGLYVTLTFHP
jgi:hypothetical protein